MYKYVFLDLDDTLWNFHANAKEVLREIYSQHLLGQYFESFDHYFSIYAKRNLELWEQYGKGLVTKEYLNVERFLHPLKHVGVPNAKLAEEISEEFLTLLPNKTTLMPHAIEVLDYLHSKYPLTIVSNGFIEVQYKKLRNANLENYFTHIVLSQAAKALKPDRRIFEYALELNGAHPSETIMIGDSYTADIIGAQNIGIDQVYYNKHVPIHSDCTPPTFIIDNLLELKELL
jgi:YjjG family noncanonical pyrimidine nucleotidase